MAVELCKHTPEWGVATKSTTLQLAKDNVIQFKTIQVVQEGTMGSLGSVVMVPNLDWY